MPDTTQPIMAERFLAALTAHDAAGRARPSPPYHELVAAQGGHGEIVSKPRDLAAALARAKQAVERERRQALVNVICPY